MRKDITKKFLMREKRHLDKMLSEDIVPFIFRNKINVDANQISYDKIEFKNVFSTKFTNLNTKNLVGSGHKFKNFAKKDGKIIEFNMVYCAEGSFMMGSKEFWDNNPKREEWIERPFLLGETEITQELYELVMGYNSSSSQMPINYVTWYDAIKFCNELSKLMGKCKYYNIKKEKESKHIPKDTYLRIAKADVSINENANGFRLPYEKEWEYAAKAGTNNQWSGTNDKSKLEEYAWFKDNSNKETHPVKTKKPNEWGFYDMTGNVKEWCWDKRDDVYESRFARITRGGDVAEVASQSNSTKRDTSMEWAGLSTLGFRVAAFI